MKNKVVTADEAIAIIRDGDTLANTGFVGDGAPEELLAALERRFLQTGRPRNLTIVFAAGQGDGSERGLNRLGHSGLLKRVVGGHWGLIPRIGQLALADKVEAYNLPQGVISHLYRDIAAGKPGTITKVGLRTFVDPRLEGGKINAISTEDLVQVIELDGEEWLFYKAFPINVAFVRGTTADPDGNITMEREALTLDNLAMATAARNSGGFVIAQVERVAEAGSLNPRQVKIPGVMVDCVVVAQPELPRPDLRHPVQPGVLRRRSACRWRTMPPMPLDERKIIARRAAFELPAGRRRQPRHRHARGRGLGRQRGKDPEVRDADGRARGDRRVAGERAQLRRRGQLRGDHRPEPAVRLLRRRRPGHGLPRPRRVRPPRQPQRQPLRPQARRRRRLHQHQPERAQGRLRRHVHRRRPEHRRRGRQAQDRPGGAGAEVRRAGRPGHLQRRVRRRDRPADPLRHRALRLPPDQAGPGAARGGARASTSSATSSPTWPSSR